MLKADKLLELADYIEKMPAGKYADRQLGFDMRVWHEEWCDYTHTDCGTASCIGGTATILFDLRDSVEVASFLSTEDDKPFDEFDAGFDAYETLHRLFYPSGENNMGWRATPQEAARVIRHLAETGKVDWTIIDKAATPTEHPVEDLHRLADDGGPVLD